MTQTHSDKAALRGEPSYVWREGQQRRLQMILDAAGDRINGRIFVDGCGLGSYLGRLAAPDHFAIGLDIEFDRTVDAFQKTPRVICGMGEHLPFPDSFFDLTLSHEVLEHVQDDRLTIREIVRTLKPGGRLVLFCPNRGYLCKRTVSTGGEHIILATSRWSTTCPAVGATAWLRM